MTTPKKPHTPFAGSGPEPRDPQGSAAPGWQLPAPPLLAASTEVRPPTSKVLPRPDGANSHWLAPKLSLATAATLALGGALIVSSLSAWALVGLWGADAIWAAPLAAAVGVVAALVSLGSLALRWQLRSGLLLGPQDVDTVPAALLPSGIPRSLFLELAAREWSRARRYGTGAALLIVEVDRFARLLESRGIDVTDAVLAEMLLQTAPTLRGADLLTRYSDSEMAVFLAQADATGALDVAERIRERSELLEVLLPGQPQRLRVTVSVGVAQLRPAHPHLQALLDDAEDAVVAARQAGGNCVRAAPVEFSHLRSPGAWRGNQRAQPK